MSDIEEFGRQVYIESSRAIAEAAPKVFLNIGVAILVWLFGNLVFVPISEGLLLGQYAVTEIISLIILATIGVLILSTIVQIRTLSNAAAGLIAYNVGGRRGEVTATELDHYKTALNGIVMVGVVALAFLLLSANLNVIHPALAGIVLIGVVLWMVVALWRSGRALAAEIGRGASQLAQRLEERGKHVA